MTTQASSSLSTSPMIATHVTHRHMCGKCKSVCLPQYLHRYKNPMTILKFVFKTKCTNEKCKSFGETGLIACPMCEKTFTKPSSYRDHINTHEDQDHSQIKFKCCTFSTTNPVHLHEHIVECHVPDSMEIVDERVVKKPKIINVEKSSSNGTNNMLCSNQDVVVTSVSDRIK